MALSERLRQTRDQYKADSTVCKLMSVTLSPKLSEEDVDTLLKIINAQPGDELHVPNVRLAQALREEGFDVSPSAVDRHKNNTCACRREAVS